MGQASPAAGIDADVFRAGQSPADVVVVACNRGAATTFRIALCRGETAAYNYLTFDHPIEDNDSLASIPIRVYPGYVVRCRSASGNVSFSVTESGNG